MTLPPPRSTPPPSPRRRFRAGPTGRGFWAGAGGVVVTLLIGALLVALLVGWILLWALAPGGPRAAMITLGSIAFAAALGTLTVLQVALRGEARRRRQERTFLTAISHNLRTPLASIQAAAQALDRPGLTDEQRARLRRTIRFETRRLVLRVENVLETNRIEIERDLFAEDVVDLTELARIEVDASAPAVEAAGGRIAMATDEAVAVGGDGRSLRLIVENLVDNAVKYADGPAAIEVAVEASGPHALLRVFDRGIGFDPETAGDLFARFTRGDTGRPGTGLGLSLARAIARGHGGDLHLASDGPGQGAVAELWLPSAHRVEVDVEVEA